MPHQDEEAPTRHLHFRWTWRLYQQRVLDAVEAHLDDRRLHVVAAPGAGKTVLGLEVFRRLHQPAVVLAPTRIIRDQWIQRLCDFLPPGAATPPPWVSRSLDAPGFLTALTYQALHTRHRQRRAAEAEDGEEAALRAVSGLTASPTREELHEVIALFRAARVQTLILDEAHHLRAAWWKALMQVVDQLDHLTLVALTATPPYDVVGAEWKRYDALCGPIDEEISVPELVRSGTLCPHQDFVWAVAPAPEEHVSLADYDRRVRAITRDLLHDAVFCKAVLQHHWITSEEPDPVAVLEDPAFAVALLVYLKAVGVSLPPPLLRLFDVRGEAVPAMDRPWWQLLVQRYLFAERGWPETDEVVKHREALGQRLRSDKLLSRRILSLESSRVVETHLALSAAKMQACLAIHALEKRVRGDALRQAILTDFIREGEAGRLGAWPLFLSLATATKEAPEDNEFFQWGLLVVSLLGLIYAAPRLYQSIRVAIRHAPVAGTLHQIALVVRDALLEADVMQTPREALRLDTVQLYPGVWSVSMEGGTFYEKSLFTDALAEVLAPLENPRYVVTRQGYGRWAKRKDYHAVPAILAVNKQRAVLFARHWQQRIGPTELIYTRSREGRTALLHGRGHALSSAFVNPVKRRDRWH